MSRRRVEASGRAGLRGEVARHAFVLHGVRRPVFCNKEPGISLQTLGLARQGLVAAVVAFQLTSLSARVRHVVAWISRYAACLSGLALVPLVVAWQLVIMPDTSAVVFGDVETGIGRLASVLARLILEFAVALKLNARYHHSACSSQA